MNNRPVHSIEEIVNGCKNNNRYFQEYLYKEYFETMMRMCHRYTSDPDKAIDIVNNGFLRVFKKIHMYQFKGSFEGWIRRLVFHALSDYFRKENTYLKFMVFEDRDQKLAPTVTDDLHYEDIMKLVDDLPDMTRQVFIKYAIEGFNHREIGDELGMKEGTSKWHLSNARTILKSRINQRNESSKYAK